MTRAKQHLGWPVDPPFYIPDAALTHFRSTVESGQALEQAWRQKVDHIVRQALTLLGR